MVGKRHGLKRPALTAMIDVPVMAGWFAWEFV